MKEKEKKITKHDLFLLKEHSSLDDSTFKELFHQYGLASVHQWKEFGYYALLICGIGFLVSGIGFFFAFNWDQMTTTVKFSIVGLGILLSTYGAITSRVTEVINKISLIATSVLVGVLLAVFGQTYQTGANAYDLFLTWLIVVTPLTMVSQSTYQWLFFSILANTTLVLALVQVLQITSVFLGIILLISINGLLLVVPQLRLLHPNFELGKLYKQIQSVAVYILATAGFGFWIFSKEYSYQPSELQGAIWMLIIAIGLIGGGLALGWKQKQIYLFSYALIAAVSCGLMIWMRLFKDTAEGLLVYMLYALGGIFFIIKLVSNKSKTWKDEN